MKILGVFVENFGSYKQISFNFSNQGLTLISGPTGSGKSTLCDMIPWVLFGTTAKNGPVDDVRNWGSEEPTKGVVIVDVLGKQITIQRTRGDKSNDLVYSSPGFTSTRGKDLIDTQKQINSLLGITSETYLAGAYYHEFSPTAQFFSTTAKNRRILTEELANLSLATDLSNKISNYSKQLKIDLQESNIQYSVILNTYDQVSESLNSTTKLLEEWQNKKENNLINIQNKVSNFESLKEQSIKVLIGKRVAFDQDIESKISLLRLDIQDTIDVIKENSYYDKQLDALEQRKQSLDATKCKECGAAKDSNKHLILVKDSYNLEKRIENNNKNKIWVTSQERSIVQLQNRVNPYIEQIEQEKLRENTHIQQYDDLFNNENPHKTVLDLLKARYIVLKKDKLELLEEIQQLKLEQTDLDLLSKVIADFRGLIIQQTLKYLQTNTNDLLTKYFDAEIRVTFEIQDSDKLDVTIHKDGNICNFTQLSKGQRQLLKLTFGLSVMKAVSNHSGVDFNCVFLDECTDGLDEEMKLKAFNLLSNLEQDYESIFLVEHSEALKSCFNNRYEVELIDGNSHISEAK